MVVALAWTFLVVVLAIVACVVAYAERRARPLPYWRLLPLPLMIAAATVVLFYVPPSNDLGDPAVWMAALVSGVVGVARGAWVWLEVDHQQRRFLLRRAPEAFWIALAATALIAADILAEPVGRLDSSFVQTAELGLTVLTSFLVGRNAALLVRSRDIPQHDL
jgi:hypothetical protein